jgi:hypothetical protein
MVAAAVEFFNRLLVFPKWLRPAKVRLAHSSTEWSRSLIGPPLRLQRSLLRCDQRPLGGSPPQVEKYCHVARVRHMNDKKKADHWRKA